ncbi:MAG: molecular chaperone DnaJ [Acidobacteriota bacterium]|nr:molecular chaperone DnaJ [Acidobacteriota bacterium]
MSERDYYEILGVSRDATTQEIKSAYRKLAVRYHPDRNADDQQAEEKFKEAAEAYAVLFDADKRARYDRFGRQGVSGGGFSGFDPDTFGDFSDILGDFFGFGDLFGQRRGRAAAEPGADLRYRLEITLEEAAFGLEKTLEIPRLERCATCEGGGSAPGSEPAACQACGGQGQVRFSQGFFTVARTCPQCRGEGRVVTDPCVDCQGAGRIEKRRKIEVKIPPGVDTGVRLRLAGEGEHSRRGGPAGDLFVDLAVVPHDVFYREGAHVSTSLEVSYPQAVLGTTMTIRTLHGDQELDIPAGTRQGSQFRLKGMGIDRLGRGGRGDHIVVIELAVPHPRDLSEEALDKLREMAELQGDEIREDRGVFDKVRNLFG